MKIFVAKNIEMFGCPFEIIIFTDTLESAETKLLEKYPDVSNEFVLQLDWDVIDDNLYEASLG